MRGHFLRKNFFLVFVWVFYSQTYSALKPEEINVLVRARPSGGVVVVEVAEGRRKVEGRRKTLVDEKKNNLLGCSGYGNLSLASIGLIFIVKDTLGAVFEAFGASLGFAQSTFWSPLFGSWVHLSLNYGTALEKR